jgi:hypothetical protein
VVRGRGVPVARLLGMNRNSAAGIAGLAGVVLNIAAVAALHDVPHAYRPGDVMAWLAELQAHPLSTQVSAWTFTVGLVSLAAFAVGLALTVANRRTLAVTDRRNLAVAGAVFFGGGALLDAAGTMAPVGGLHVEPSVGVALLWFTLLLDSAFNGLLAIGLLCLASALRADDGWPASLRWLGYVAGAASLPVALQFSSDGFARLLAVSAPLWLVWVTWTSVLLLRGRRAGPD